MLCFKPKLSQNFWSPGGTRRLKKIPLATFLRFRENVWKNVQQSYVLDVFFFKTYVLFKISNYVFFLKKINGDLEVGIVFFSKWRVLNQNHVVFVCFFGGDLEVVFFNSRCYVLSQNYRKIFDPQEGREDSKNYLSQFFSRFRENVWKMCNSATFWMLFFSKRTFCVKSHFYSKSVFFLNNKSFGTKLQDD